MKTPEELFAALGNRGEYAALPSITLDEVNMIYAEGQAQSNQDIGEFQNQVRDLVLDLSGAPHHYIDGKGSDAGWQDFTLAEISQGFSYISEQRSSERTSLKKLRLAVNEAMAISGTGTPQDWTAAQVGLCRVLEEVKVMLGEKS